MGVGNWLLLLGLTLFILGCSAPAVQTSPREASDIAASAAPVEIKPPVQASTSTALWEVFCDRDATRLQKKAAFDGAFNRVFIWSGEVSSVPESGDRMLIRQCSSTFTADITVRMLPGETSKLLSLKEGDLVRYEAKLTSYNPGVVVEPELAAIEGELVEVQEQPERTVAAPEQSVSPVVIEPLASDTKNGITLLLESYTYEKKGDDFGKLMSVGVLIDNKGSEVIFPALEVSVRTPNGGTNSLRTKVVGMDFYLSPGERVRRTVPVELSFNDIENGKILRVALKDGSWASYVLASTELEIDTSK